MELNLNFWKPYRIGGPIVKVQNHKDSFLQENPTSNCGLDGEFSISNQLLLTLEYLRQYPTFLSLGFSYGISESYTHKIFYKMKPILADIIGLKNPDKLKYKDIKTVIIDSDRRCGNSSTHRET